MCLETKSCSLEISLIKIVDEHNMKWKNVEDLEVLKMALNDSKWSIPQLFNKK